MTKRYEMPAHHAGVKLTGSDGESRVIRVGGVILVDDTTGKGHLSQHGSFGRRAAVTR